MKPQRLRFFYIGPWFISYYRYEKGRRGQRRWWRRRLRSRCCIGGTDLFPRGCLRFGEENRGAHGAAGERHPTLQAERIHSCICSRRRSDGDTWRRLSSSSKLVKPPMLSSCPLFGSAFVVRLGSHFVVRLVSSEKQNYSVLSYCPHVWLCFCGEISQFRKTRLVSG